MQAHEMTADVMTANGIPEDAQPAVKAAVAAGLDWTTILTLLAQYGPVLLGILKRLFTTPTPTP